MRALHLINALVSLGIGLYCTAFARSAAESLGIAFSHPTGLTDFRATYGGMTLAFGCFFGLAFSRVVDDRAGLWLSLFFYAGLGFVRLAGMLSERPQLPLMSVFLLLELLLFGASLCLVLRD